MLRWLLWIIGGLVVLLIVALLAVPPWVFLFQKNASGRTDAAAASAKAAQKRYEAAKLKLFREVKEAMIEHGHIIEVN